jgi:hypothetical protein
LRVWHWRALAKAHAAGERGLDDEGGVSYGRIGWRTWLTWLRDYRGKAHGLGGLVEEREVGYANRSFVHRLFITADGKRFYREDWEEYRKRYPEVEAPFPEEF